MLDVRLLRSDQFVSIAVARMAENARSRSMTAYVFVLMLLVAQPPVATGQGVDIQPIEISAVRADTSSHNYLADLESDNFRVRANAADGLTESRDAAVEPLVRLIHRPESAAMVAQCNSFDEGKWCGNDPEIGLCKTTRQWAVVILGRIRNRRAVAPLIEVLDDSNPTTRGLAAWALSEIGDDDAIEPLSKRLAAESDLNVFANAAIALGTLGSAAVPYLAAAYDRERDSDKRSTLLDAVYENKDKAALEMLTVACNDTDSGVRATARYLASRWPGSQIRR
jgi:HEAT repeat protein